MGACPHVLRLQPPRRPKASDRGRPDQNLAALSKEPGSAISRSSAWRRHQGSGVGSVELAREANLTHRSPARPQDFRLQLQLQTLPEVPLERPPESHQPVSSSSPPRNPRPTMTRLLLVPSRASGEGTPRPSWPQQGRAPRPEPPSLPAAPSPRPPGRSPLCASPPQR